MTPWYTWSSTGAIIGLIMIPLYHYFNYVLNNQRLLEDGLFDYKKNIDLFIGELHWMVITQELDGEKLHEIMKNYLKLSGIPYHLTNKNIIQNIWDLNDKLVELWDLIHTNLCEEKYTKEEFSELNIIFDQYEDIIENKYITLIKNCSLGARFDFAVKGNFLD